MRLFASGMIAIVLMLPGPAFGQAVKPADLVGTWMWRRNGGELIDSLSGQLQVTYLKFDPNGAYAYRGEIKNNDGEWRAYGVGWAKGSWLLTADTLRLVDDRNSSVSYKVVQKDGRLLLWDWPMWDAARQDEKCAAQVFERFDASTPLTLPPPLQITIQEEELVGTWAGTYETKQHGTVSDTLILDADHSVTSIHHGWGPHGSEYFPNRNTPDQGGGWALLPGDEFTAWGILGRYRIMLHNGELISCSPVRPILKRVTP